jgi:2-polyprenyl-3-methyl-5-hydroxy-6-metoxy-1,4-benzoquinol methylase
MATAGALAVDLHPDVAGDTLPAMINAARVHGRRGTRSREPIAPPLIEPSAFRDAYLQAVQDVMRFVTPERQSVIARHDASLLPANHDLGLYLRASVTRYRQLVRLVNAHARVDRAAVRALEVGGFLGAYPLALARLGISVTLVEHYEYYDGALDELAGYLAASGVEIWDVDFTAKLEVEPPQYTLVTNMAMIEHLPDSPKQLLENLRASTAATGLLVLEVPNIAYYHRRRQLLLGRSVHPELEQLYISEIPYVGHRREYTAAELAQLVSWTGMHVCETVLFNYSLSLRRGSWFERFHDLVLELWPTYLFPRAREVIMVAASFADDPAVA